MDTYDIDEAETDLSRLVEKAAKGEPFVIAKAGKPLVRVMPIAQPIEKPRRRFGSLKGVFTYPDDIKAFGRDEIEEMFFGPDA